MAIHRLARPLRRSSLSAGFFTSHQPANTLRSAASTSLRPISFSSSSGAPSDSSSGSQGARNPRAKVLGSSSQPAARSSSPSPQRKLGQSAQPQPAAPALKLSQASTPWASELPHAGPALVSYDGFFSLHRPLLELPVRFRARKLTAPIKPATLNNLSLDHAPEHEVLQAFETLEVNAHQLEDGAEEFVQVVDLAEDGSTLGAPYVTSIASAPLSSFGEDILRDVDATAESLLAEDVEFEAELAHSQLESEAREDGDSSVRLESPYDAHLIGEPEGFMMGPTIARYLAEHQPFCHPPPPTPATSAEKLAARAAQPETDGRTQSALAFLRPFSSNQPQTVSPLLTAVPLSASEAQLQADKFLAGAQMQHQMAAHRDAIDFVHEPLALAANYYAAPVTHSAEFVSPVRGSFEGVPRQAGEVRVWSEQSGWSVVDFSGIGSNPDSPFLPAEMVDLDWEDEFAACEGGVLLDSTKRKRKKKITKHKYKKRRKAQRALRQRLGK